MAVKRQTTEATEPRAVVSWTGKDQPITLTSYDQNGKVAGMKLSPTRALALAQDLIAPAVQSIKFDQWGESWPG